MAIVGWYLLLKEKKIIGNFTHQIILNGKILLSHLIYQ